MPLSCIVPFNCLCVRLKRFRYEFCKLWKIHDLNYYVKINMLCDEKKKLAIYLKASQYSIALLDAEN